jgi:beta-glucuronidase
VVIEIPEPETAVSVRTAVDGKVKFELKPDAVELWSPKHPKLYRVTVSTADDRVEDEIGFRTISTRGHDILLNGEPIFLRGICIHEEPIGPVGRRGLDWETARQMLTLARDQLGCNFVRLAHYPHSEKMTRLADRLGVLVWSEVPVYWAIAYDNPHTRDVAVQMVTENVMRDRNRASIIVWSVANETPINDARNAFLGAMIDRGQEARLFRASRLVRDDRGSMARDLPVTSESTSEIEATAIRVACIEPRLVTTELWDHFASTPGTCSASSNRSNRPTSHERFASCSSNHFKFPIRASRCCRTSST